LGSVLDELLERRGEPWSEGHTYTALEEEDVHALSAFDRFEEVPDDDGSADSVDDDDEEDDDDDEDVEKMSKYDEEGKNGGSYRASSSRAVDLESIQGGIRYLDDGRVVLK
jgi:hypothetical protein